MAVWMDLTGTIHDELRIGLDKARLDAAGLTGLRTIALPDSDGTLLVAPGPVTAHWSPDDIDEDLTLSGDDLVVDLTGAGPGLVRAILAIATGKFYWEVLAGNATDRIGVATLHAGLPAVLGADAEGWGHAGDGQVYAGGAGSALGSGFAAGDVVGVALDMDAGALWWSVNGVWQSGDPAAGTGAAVTGLTDAVWPTVSKSAAGALTGRFAAATWSHAAPAGFVALTSAEL